MSNIDMNMAEKKSADTNKAGVKNMSFKKLILISLTGLLLTSCESDKSTKLQDSLDKDGTVDAISNYDLGNSVIPFPNDFLFAPDAGTASDGTLNIPVDDADDLSDPKVAMNGLDGFSTNAPMTTGFTGAINEDSISGDSVRVYPITKGGGPAGPATAVGTPLVFGVDYIAAVSSVDSSGSTLAILPLKPLAEKSSFAVVITNDLESSSGRSMGISASYALTRGEDSLYNLAVPPAVPPSTVDEIRAAILSPLLAPAADASDAVVIATGVSAFTLESLRAGIVKPTEDAIVASDADVDSEDIILHWTFTTQSTTDVLAQVRTDVRMLTATAGFAPAGVTSPLGAANINVGALTVPYYLTAAASGADPTPLGSFWKGPADSFLTYLAANVSPVATSTQAIPMMVSIPIAAGACAAGMPGTGWPVVIYQHGITTNRATMLAVADAMAGACMAVVAIDMPMHGLTGNETNGTEAFKGVPVPERTFDLDIVTQDADGNTIAAGADGTIDRSGAHFINLSNLQNTRDNVRQAVSDLFVIVDAIEDVVLSDGANIMDPNRIYFLGHSLGAMVGTVFVALEPGVKDAAFAFGGASLPKILDGSAAFGPTIAAGLAANDVIKGTPDYESFIGAAQTVVDSGDPVNHAATAATGRGILFFEIVGGNSSPSDLVVPNTVPDGNDDSGTVPAPLAGTEAQLALMGLTQHNASTAGADLHVVTKFISGDHSSLLDPGPDAAVTTEIQTQAVNFFGSDGAALVVTDDTVLQAP